MVVCLVGFLVIDSSVIGLFFFSQFRHLQTITFRMTTSCHFFPRSLCIVNRSRVGLIDESRPTRASHLPVFSPRTLIAFGHENYLTLDNAKVIGRHAVSHPYMSSFSSSALIKDGSSCVHIPHFRT